MKRMHLLSALVAAVFLATGAARADSFPSKPVTLMVPYPAGGLSDIIARKVNAALATELKQPVIIENLGGAGGAIAAQKVLNSPADGYIIFQGSPNELILGPLALKAVKYKPEDFRLVQQIAVAPISISARKDFPPSNARELVAYARKAAMEGKPVSYASVGIGSLYHLMGEDMARKMGTTMLHVPYKGGGPILQDLLGGQIDMFITPYGAPHVAMEKEGKLKFVTALSEKPQRLIPHVSSVDEAPELKRFYYMIGSGYYVKAGTPEPVVEALHRALTKVMSDSELRSILTALGQELPTPLRLDEAAKAYADEIKLYQGIAKSINLQSQ
jgi:tripartite-type tricarboxylate transporter receptor subunit TctC